MLAVALTAVACSDDDGGDSDGLSAEPFRLGLEGDQQRELVLLGEASRRLDLRLGNVPGENAGHTHAGDKRYEERDEALHGSLFYR